MVQLVYEFSRLHWFGFWMLGILTDYARLQVAGQKFNAKRVQSRTDRGDLVQDLNAIPLFFNHPLDPSDLPGDTVDSSPYLFPGVLLHPDTYTLYRYFANGMRPEARGGGEFAGTPGVNRFKEKDPPSGRRTGQFR
jgi:hypothetical protein